MRFFCLGPTATRTAILGVLLWCGGGCADQVPAAPADVFGCFQLTEDPWSAERVPYTGRYEPDGDVPPVAFEVYDPMDRRKFAAAEPRRRVREMAVRAAPGWPPLATARTDARVRQDSLHVVWSTGFTGLLMKLQPGFNGLSGRALSISDDASESEWPSQPVRYERVPCAGLDFTPLEWVCDSLWCRDFR